MLFVTMRSLYLTYIFVLISVCLGQQDLPCPQGNPCIPRGSCDSYHSQLEKLRTLTKGTNEYRFLELFLKGYVFYDNIFRVFLIGLKGWICNKSARKVCCKDEIPAVPKTGSLSPLYLPNADKLECGFSANAEFIVGMQYYISLPFS